MRKTRLMIHTILMVLLGWFALSIPLGIAIGHLIAGRPLRSPAEPIMPMPQSIRE